MILQTSEGTDIPNYQIREVSAFEANQFADLDANYGASTSRRAEPTPVYNCHGMTFASRRTGIYDDPALYTILREDRYVEVPRDDVLPGDVICYFDDKGAITHTGLVVTSPRDEVLRVPKVCSKWGKYAEVIHWANDCPYREHFATARYYRVRQ